MSERKRVDSSGKASLCSSTGFVLDPQHYVYHYWLGVISFAVVYNLLLIPARSSFDELDRDFRAIWIALDYTFDLIYLIDIFLQSRTGDFFSRSARTRRILLQDISVMDCSFKIIGFSLDGISLLETSTFAICSPFCPRIFSSSFPDIGSSPSFVAIAFFVSIVCWNSKN